LPVFDLVEPGEGDPRIGEEVNGVPPLGTEPPLDEDERCDDDGDQEDGADRRRDHPRIDAAPDHRRQLTEEAEPVERRVPPDAQEDVGDDEVDADVAVPAVPARQAVETDRALERGDPRQQEHLEEREVGGEQACEPREARQSLTGRVHVEVPAVHPQPDDHAGVRGQERQHAGGLRPLESAALHRRREPCMRAHWARRADPF
jgi:hypothetical protein